MPIDEYELHLSAPSTIAWDAGRSRVGHNAVLNFLALVVPLGLAFFIMPIAARGFGPTRFGLLGLAWAVTEYLTLFDLGLGRALVKFVADGLHDRSAQLSEIITLSMLAQILAGVAGGIAFALAAPLVVANVFKVPDAIATEAVGTFRVVGLSVPVVLLISGQRAVLEGAQRFDLSATIKMVTSILSLTIPAIGAVAGWSLPVVMLNVLASRLVMSLVYTAAIKRAIPGFRWVTSRDWPLFRRVLTFGAWVLISNTVSPLLVYFDRFALGSIAGLAAVGFYTAPYEGVTRMLLIPVALFGSLLPALTAIEAGGETARFGRLASSSERVLSQVMALPLAFIAVFAPEILQAWLGPDYAAHSATALRLLAIGVFTNSLANPLLVTLYAKNRPDLPAKFHLSELTVHVPLTIFLIRTYGVAGAGAAWCIRVTADMVLLLLASARVSGESPFEVLGGRVWRSTVSIAVLVAGIAGSQRLHMRHFSALAVIILLFTLATYVRVSWRWVLGEPERGAILSTFRSYAKLLPRRSASG
jgi:O-antigen/teichoic acid export membrane protein